ncbi:hypothetical protein ES708_14299 [subsurface metagenome]
MSSILQRLIEPNENRLRKGINKGLESGFADKCIERIRM